MKPRPFTLVPWASGDGGTIYSVQIDGDVYEDGTPRTELDRFLDDPDVQASPEFDALNEMLDLIIDAHGARDRYFTSKDKYPPPLAALRYDKGALRIYCCQYTQMLLVCGGGGIKPPEIRLLEDVPELDAAYNWMRYVSDQIDARIRSKDLAVHLAHFEGDLDFDLDD